MIFSALCVWVQKNAIGEHSVVQGQISRISSMAITGSNELHAANVSHPIPSLQFRYVLMYYVQVSRRMFMFLFFIGSWSWKILWQTWEIIIVFTFMIEEVEFSTYHFCIEFNVHDQYLLAPLFTLELSILLTRSNDQFRKV